MTSLYIDAALAASLGLAAVAGSEPPRYSPPIFEVFLPMEPPSVNHYWKTHGRRRFISEAGVAFHALCVPLVRQAAEGWQPKTRLWIVADVIFSTRRRRDIDNILKPLLDSIAQGLVCDDSQFDALTVRRLPPNKEVFGVKVAIGEIIA